MDGIIIINKPKNCTSHDIVSKIKKTVHEKVGHTGTLDPNATGVLPILVGKGTLLSKYLINHDKTYKAILQLGEKRSTADIEGEIIEKRDVDNETLKEENVKKVLESFIGKQEQIPPIYSAIKVNGKKLYEYARKNQEVKIEPRKIEIYDMKLISINNEEKCIEFEVKCSKGTYIRSLCEDIAERLNNVGYMKELEREQVGEFKIENAIKIDELDKINEKIISLEDFFENKKSIKLNNHKINLLLNGVMLSYEDIDDVYKIYDESNKFIGIATIEKGLLKRDIII